MSGGGQVHTMIRVGEKAHIAIGNNVGISNSTLFSEVGVTVEDNVMIGVNCVITDTDNHSVDYTERLNGTGIKNAPILIREGAWIGGHSIILKGVTIGQHSVVGAGSVVTKDIPDNEVWAGNPARFIKGLQ